MKLEEFPGARRGTPGIGDIHTIELGVASADLLDFWQERLESKATPVVNPRAARRRETVTAR